MNKLIKFLRELFYVVIIACTIFMIGSAGALENGNISESDLITRFVLCLIPIGVLGIIYAVTNDPDEEYNV